MSTANRRSVTGGCKISTSNQATGDTTWARWEPTRFNDPANRHQAATKAGASGGQLSPALQEELDRLREAAREEGYRAGFESGQSAGLEAGMEEAKAAAAVLAAQLGSAIQRFDRGVSRLEEDVAQQLLNLALGIARRIVGDTLEVQPEAILESIREAIAQLPAQHAVIHLNREDAELMRSHASEFLTHAGHRILENSQLKRGDVLVEAGGTQIDARLATRWQRVWESLEPEPGTARSDK